jgi:hypothetical protein
VPGFAFQQYTTGDNFAKPAYNPMLDYLTAYFRNTNDSKLPQR